MDYHTGNRLFVGIFVFLVYAALCMLASEMHLLYYMDMIWKQSEHICKPSDELLKDWMGGVAERSKTAYSVTEILTIITIGLLAAFCKTGTAVFLLFAMCVCFVMYYIWSVLNPNLQKKYIKVFLNETKKMMFNISAGFRYRTVCAYRLSGCFTVVQKYISTAK